MMHSSVWHPSPLLEQVAEGVAARPTGRQAVSRLLDRLLIGGGAGGPLRELQHVGPHSGVLVGEAARHKHVGVEQRQVQQVGSHRHIAHTELPFQVLALGEQCVEGTQHGGHRRAIGEECLRQGRVRKEGPLECLGQLVSGQLAILVGQVQQDGTRLEQLEITILQRRYLPEWIDCQVLRCLVFATSHIKEHSLVGNIQLRQSPFCNLSARSWICVHLNCLRLKAGHFDAPCSVQINLSQTPS
mmetsp:Transcript_14461/g.31350  ORF Transcript_14461/g.31350 Transcript_14461/m.31350 type:complete len:243 (-) Transcript_14461:78-806(-)